MNPAVLDPELLARAEWLANRVDSLVMNVAGMEAGTKRVDQAALRSEAADLRTQHRDLLAALPTGIEARKGQLEEEHLVEYREALKRLRKLDDPEETAVFATAVALGQ